MQASGVLQESDERQSTLIRTTVSYINLQEASGPPFSALDSALEHEVENGCTTRILEEKRVKSKHPCGSDKQNLLSMSDPILAYEYKHRLSIDGSDA